MATAKYSYDRFEKVWEKELDFAKLSPETLFSLAKRGAHEALKDTFAGVKVKEGEGVVPEVALQEAQDDFVSGLEKKFAQLLDGSFPDYVPGGRGSGVVRDPREEMIIRVATEYLRSAAKAAQKKLPKVASDEYKTIFDKFRAANEAKIVAEADKRLKAGAKVEVDLTGVF